MVSFPRWYWPGWIPTWFSPVRRYDSGKWHTTPPSGTTPTSRETWSQGRSKVTMSFPLLSHTASVRPELFTAIAEPRSELMKLEFINPIRQKYHIVHLATVMSTCYTWARHLACPCSNAGISAEPIVTFAPASLTRWASQISRNLPQSHMCHPASGSRNGNARTLLARQTACF